MPIDPNISLQAQAPDASKKFGDILSLARGAIDYNIAKATQESEIARQKAVSEQSQIAAKKAQFGLSQDQLQQVQNDFNSIAQDPLLQEAERESDPTKRAALGAQLAERLKTHADFAESAGVPSEVVNRTMGPYIAMALRSPDKLRQFVAQRQQAGLSAAGQVAQTQVPVGAQQSPAGTDIYGRPLVQIRDQFGNIRLSPMQTGAAQEPLPSKPTSAAPIQTSAGLGQAELTGGIIKQVTQDWQDTQDKAASAERTKGLLGNIKQLVKQGAITGVGGERRALAAGIAGLLGREPSEEEKTNTDLLMKNSNLLALAGGNTDAARALAESANPNTKMTPEAIQHAADLLIANQEMALSKQQYLAKHIRKAASDPTDQGKAYSEKLSMWNQVSDPRIWQLNSMSDNDVQKLRAGMSDPEWKDFVAKAKKAKQMGVVK